MATGIVTTTSLLTRQYRRIKEAILHPEAVIYNEAVKAKTGDGVKRHKKMHAKAYIMMMAKNAGDASVENPNTTILPYENVTEIFEEYRAHYNRKPQLQMSVPSETVAGRSVFFLAFEDLEHNEKLVKLRNSKGSFETCSICNNLNDALKSASVSWTLDQLEIVLKVKRLHLNQQAIERQDSVSRKQMAMDTFIKGCKRKYYYQFKMLIYFNLY